MLLYLVTALPSGNEPRFTIRTAFGVILDAKQYMDWERMCRGVLEHCKKYGYSVQLPSSFNPRICRVWQKMGNYKFAHYTVFPDFILRRLRVLEQELTAIDNATVGFCIRGCEKNCLIEELDAAGRRNTPLIEQFYLHLPAGIKVVRVSRRPASCGCIDQHHQYVLEEEVFQQRKSELIALCRWQSKREALDRHCMPVSAAGERPAQCVPQEDLTSLEMGDQQCSWPRTPILNEDWEGFSVVSSVGRANSDSGAEDCGLFA